MTTTDLRRGTGADQRTDARHNSPFTLIVLLTGVFMALLDFFIVNVALPDTQHDLHASSAGIQWVVAGYGLALASALVTGGRLGDLFGRKRMFVLGLLVFAAASAACGLAPNPGVLIGARVAQGIGAALFMPQILGVIGAAFSGAWQARAFTGYGLTAGLGAVFGQLIGGSLIQANLFGLGWRSIYWINVPIGLAAALLAVRALPSVPRGGRTRLDPVGGLLLTLAVVALVLPLVEGRQDGWPAWTWACLAASPVLLGLFYVHQRRLIGRGGEPVLNPVLFTQRSFAAGMPIALVYNTGVASFFFVLALYLQQGRGMSALDSGLLFIAVGLPYLATSMRSGTLAARFGRKLMTVGCVGQAAGYALLDLTAHEAGVGRSVLWLAPAMAVVGATMGLAYAPMFGVVLAGVDRQHASSASGLLSTVQQVGGATGIALAGIVFFDALGARPTAAAYTAAFGVALLLLTAITLVAAALMRLLPVNPTA
ncbi:MFS transporter [Actinospica sp. MGRD01-02]|uniref:MFS transporter n=1 Tax=Actinospica acidithermotolerans TaxID=2828514 RepID=A0A941EI32_9ACTN|nr:MFS transporter [Actinospica acidithermotolerans]MBR7830823.1 MFS transporter [Actinospica acidithermotolerans]